MMPNAHQLLSGVWLLLTKKLFNRPLHHGSSINVVNPQFSFKDLSGIDHNNRMGEWVVTVNIN